MLVIAIMERKCTVNENGLPVDGNIFAYAKCITSAYS